MKIGFLRPAWMQLTGMNIAFAYTGVLRRTRSGAFIGMTTMIYRRK